MSGLVPFHDIALCPRVKVASCTGEGGISLWVPKDLTNYEYLLFCKPYFTKQSFGLPSNDLYVYDCWSLV